MAFPGDLVFGAIAAGFFTHQAERDDGPIWTITVAALVPIIDIVTSRGSRHPCGNLIGSLGRPVQEPTLLDMEPGASRLGTRPGLSARGGRAPPA